MKNRNYLIVYINKAQPRWHKRLENFLDDNKVPYLLCWDRLEQAQKNIVRVPTIELPNGNLIFQEDLINNLETIFQILTKSTEGET
jgi:hypothetical protein